ncbi:TATA box-binding protein-like protein 1 [Trichinella murrelli]|uniref:TATA box-binding protein-like 1 n=1 Tax=Trichinella murrelli TaxID=144512 RepID=A0A0V0U2D8_9BILA|nr:TATA box-binding protein-like protein 1 [Trichinella murrelli]
MLVGYADAAFVVKMSQSTCYKARRMNGLISSIIPAPGSVAVPATIAAPVSGTLVNIGTLQPQKAGQIVTSSYDEHCADQETIASASSNVSTSPTTTDDCLEDPIDLRIRNVVTMFNVCCHLDLHHIAMHTCNVIYERYRGVLIFQIKKPRCYVKMWSSGKITVSGAQSEEEARKSSRSVARIVQKIVGPRVRFADYRVTNIMATCKLPFGIRIPNLATEYPRESSYEPELSIGLVWRSASPKATLRIHSTGSITITGAESQADILTVMESLYPILVRFKCSTVVARQLNLPPGSKVWENDLDDDVYDDCDQDVTLCQCYFEGNFNFRYSRPGFFVCKIFLESGLMVACNLRPKCNCSSNLKLIASL